VADSAGAIVRRVAATGRRGMNRIVIPFLPAQGRGGRGGAGAGGGGGRGGGGANVTTPENAAFTVGRYVVTLEGAGERLTKPAIVRERIQRD
jgi:hypothetical protein